LKVFLMLIRFIGPFERMAEREKLIDLGGPLSVRELLGLLATRYEGMVNYAGIGTDADLSAHLVFVRNGKILRLSDSVEDEDVLQIMLPATGG